MAKIGNINLRDFPLLPAPMEDVSDRLPIPGNGDRCTPGQAVAAGEMYGAEGTLTGRVAAGYPGIFNEMAHFIRTGEHLPPPTVLERVRVCKKHPHHSITRKGDVAGILETRRHYTNYLKGLPQIKDFRQQLVTCNSLAVTE